MASYSRPTRAQQSFIAQLPLPAVLARAPWRDGGAQIVATNRAFLRLTGFRAAQLAGAHLRLLHGPKTDLVRMRAPQPSRQGTGEGWLHRKDGTAFHAQWTYAPVVGDRRHLLVLFRDATDASRQQEALVHAQKLGAVGLLAGGMAHDFNNLLSVMNGYCEILAGELRDRPAARRNLEEIHRAGLKATAIARQILGFTRPQAGAPAVVNFNTLIREMEGILRQVGGEFVELELRLASDLGNARINPGHFQQVLLNLCFNARDAMPQGGRMRLRTYNRTGAGGRAETVLEVSDTGTGIAADALARIFEPFYTTKPLGTGLGLPIARMLLSQAGGELGVRSEPGRGTTFAVVLPETAEPAATEGSALQPLPATGGSESIVVVERDTVLRKMLAGVLTAEGYRVADFSDADEALAAGVTPQLVVSDHAPVPRTSALRGLLQRAPAAPLIVTAPARLDPAVWGPRMVAQVAKPFALSVIMTKIRELLDREAVD